ncbi:hypothetical protein GY45DRAFT_154578 [Cubamyces sp. BRFM 1775]|nr:hypothetical protein GY45DRAFT_154578 [Cubamyces sp. BRFM 1775]
MREQILSISTENAFSSSGIYTPALPMTSSTPRTWSYNQCWLCGTEEDVVDIPMVPEDLEGEWRWHSTWLRKLGIIGGDRSFNTKSLSNMMKLCMNHGRAYKNNVWRWIPSAQHRREMAELPVRATPPVEFDDRGFIKHSRNRKELEKSEDDDERAALITFKPVLETYFDVLIFLPHEMPDPDARRSPGIDVLAAAQHRVVPEWMQLRLDRDVVFAVALMMLGTVYWPAPDDKLREVEQECLAIRDHWNAQVPHNTIPSARLLIKPERYE